MIPRVRSQAVRVDAQTSVLTGGLDLIAPPGAAPPGTTRFATNYEAEFGGGYRRLGGFERFSGKTSPHTAAYVLLEATGGFTGVTAGNTLTGDTSGATGTVVYVTATRIGLTKVGATPFEAEVVKVGATTVGTVTETEPTIDGFLDNELAELAANNYRADIAALPGTGAVRGVAVLNSIIYGWRDDAGTLKTYKSSAAGWVNVPYYSQVSFDAGSTQYADGSSLTQGASVATIKRVVLESGDWLAGTAKGRFIIQPAVGTMIAGACAGAGVANLTSTAAQIGMLAGGKVRSVVHNFTASLATRRLYCCDGVNDEFEFDGDVLVPLDTGMGSIRATDVVAHKEHLFFAYRSSLQHSAPGEPYVWSAILGAAEIGAGDTITNLIGVSGSESSAALMAVCKDSVWVLYGTSVADWKFTRVSEEAGAQADSVQEITGVVGFDRDGFKTFSPTQAFGNFAYESRSREIQPLVLGATVKCSVLVKDRGIYRCFFSDGLFVSGTPKKGGFAWMPCDYGRVIECVIGGEVDGQYRVFMGDADGMVLEADVGRSFDGASVFAAMRLSSQNQGSSVSNKQYRHVEVDTTAESAFTLSAAAEFDDANAEQVDPTVMASNARQQYGAGLFYDFGSWDRAYWDGSLSNRMRYPIHGHGRSVTLLFQSDSTNELPHTIKSATTLYTPRRLAR